MSVKEDPIKLHKEANALMENGKYAEARDLFVKVAELYHKGQNYFGSAEMYYKAGECSQQLKEYQKAVELFTKSADVSFQQRLRTLRTHRTRIRKRQPKSLGQH